MYQFLIIAYLFTSESIRSYNQVIKNNTDILYFLEKCLVHLKCDHETESSDTCWKCKVKSEALAGASYTNQYEIYETLRNAGAKVTPLCLYTATENQSVGTAIVRRIVDDLKQANLFLPSNQVLEFCPGHCMKHKDKSVFNFLKEEGLTITSQFVYFVVQEGDKELLSFTIQKLIYDKRGVQKR